MQPESVSLLNAGDGFARYQPFTPRQVVTQAEAQVPEIAVQDMSSRQKAQDRRTAFQESAKLDLQARVLRKIVQPLSECVGGSAPPARTKIDLGKIQVELRLAAAAAHSSVAEPFGLGPHAFRVSKTQAEIRHVIGIFRIALAGMAQQFDSARGLSIPQVSESFPKFPECIEVKHSALPWLRPKDCVRALRSLEANDAARLLAVRTGFVQEGQGQFCEGCVRRMTTERVRLGRNLGLVPFSGNRAKRFRRG